MRSSPTADVLANPAGANPVGAVPTGASPAGERIPVLPPRPVQGLGKTQPSSVPPPAAPADEVEAPSLIDISTWFRESPPWLISAIVHMVLLICIGLWVVKDEIQLAISLEGSYGEELDETLDDTDLAVEAELQSEDQALTPQTLPPVEDPFAAPTPLPIDPTASFATSDRSPTAIGMALTGREPGMKKVLGSIYGATPGTQRAVTAGLEWLVQQQLKPGPKTGANAGMWSLQGPYSDGANVENFEAATAMALIAFQGDGYTHKNEPNHPFTKAVAKGWDVLLKRQNEDGRFFNNVMDQHQLYTQALCTIAICELYGMSKDEALSQTRATGGRLLRSHSSARGRLEISARRKQRHVGHGLVRDGTAKRPHGGTGSSQRRVHSHRGIPRNRVARKRQPLCLHGSGRPEAGVNGRGLALPPVPGLAARRSAFADGRRVSAQQSARLAYEERNVYYWYYGTQVCHHMEGTDWRIWNDVIKVMLPEHQESAAKSPEAGTPTATAGAAPAADSTSPASRSTSSKSTTAICRFISKDCWGSRSELLSNRSRVVG